jgi:hypothetical protein
MTEVCRALVDLARSCTLIFRLAVGTKLRREQLDSLSECR